MSDATEPTPIHTVLHLHETGYDALAAAMERARNIIAVVSVQPNGLTEIDVPEEPIERPGLESIQDLASALDKVVTDLRFTLIAHEEEEDEG